MNKAQLKKLEADTWQAEDALRANSDVAIAKCGLYFPDHACYHYLLSLEEGKNTAKMLKQASSTKRIDASGCKTFWVLVWPNSMHSRGMPIRVQTRNDIGDTQ